MNIVSHISIQMEMKNHQQSNPRENDYEKLYSGMNHQTSDHNLGQHDAWINSSRLILPMSVTI